MPERRGKVYRGIRARGKCEVLVQSGSRTYTLRHRVLHSPTGFEWGYGGSGPADLALAILADVTGSVAYAKAMYQLFKWDVIASLPYEGWVLTEQEVRTWVDQHPGTYVPAGAAG
ncbi:MAG: DUF6166 domain-containing protein [Bacillota bacterium]|nr:MAG: hypothetical protein DIU70_01540 [Bacillota bacterium]